MAVDVGSAVGYLDLDISGFLAGLKSAQSEADKQSKNIATKIGNNLSGIGTKLSSVGTTLTKNVTVPLAAIGTAGLKVATDFEKGMSEVRAISGATGKDFDALREKAIELGADTAFSAGEVAEAMVEMAKAGWNSQQIIDGMGGVLAAAAASGESLANVSTIVADAITGFGLAASDSTKVADLLTQAANSGTIGINDLGESFKYMAPVAGAMGLSIEDVTTAISAMSMAGIKGSQAGTSLRTMLTNLVKPTDAMAVAMEQLGIEVTNQDGSMKSLNEIVAVLRDSFSGLSESEKAYYAATLAGKEGMSGMLALLNLTEEEYNAIAKSMENSAGVAETTAAVMQDNLQSKIEQFGGALESLAIKLADQVIPHLQNLVVWLTGLVDKFTQLDPETQRTILKFAAIAAAAGPVLTVVGKLTSGVGGFITTLGKIPGAATKVKSGFSTLTVGLKNVGEGFKLTKAGFGGLATQAGGLGTKLGSLAASMGPWGVVIAAAIAVVIAAFTNLWKNNEEFRNKILATWNEIKAKFESFTSGIVERLNELGFDFENIGEVLKAIWDGFCNFLGPVFTNAFDSISRVLGAVFDTILGVVDVFIGLFTGDWKQCWEGVKGILKGALTFIVEPIRVAFNTIKDMTDVILGWFGTSWSECWTAVKEFFVNLWNGIVTWFQTLLNNIATFFVNIWTSISTFFTNLWNGITSFFSNAWQTMKNIVQVGIMFIAELFKAAFQIITLPFRFIWENCKETIISVWETISSTISSALNAIKTVITDVWNAVSEFFISIWTSISTFVSDTWNSIKSKITEVIDAISSVISSVFNAIWTTITNIWNGIQTTITNIINAVKTVVTNVFNAIKTTVTNVWNGIKSAIEVPINAAKNTISNVVNTIKTSISNGFNEAKTTVTSIFDSIKQKISDVLNSASTIVSDGIKKIKEYFNFSWSLPKLKMPHFSISGEFSLDPPSVPTFNVSWYKKAMGAGMILNSATIFGYDSKTGKFLGGGEAGSETVVGTKSLLMMIRESVAEAVGPLIEVSRELARASVDLGYVTYNGFAKLKEVTDKQDKTSQGDKESGDTFIFNSPKPIDEIEAAKQMKKAKRDLAEGF